MLKKQARFQDVRRFMMVFFGAIFIIVGYLVTYEMGLPLIEQAKASKNWPTTAGLVLKSKVISHRKNNSSSSTYTAKVSYHYEVKGAQFESETVWFGGDISTSNKSMARETVKKFPVDQKVTVYYNPEDPEIAVLEPGVFKTTYFYYLFGWVFLGVGILMTGSPLFRSLFHRRKTE
ncbi:MAG: DUF3592 domain-containing protein [Planctomycetes bacterium]|nr:DUF3592 domain-containing protein [Planctomycetota bacterium]MCH9725411.1 DUF3592 domain-containing protein [Planctomycetota bacterium]MCH9776508.1 DUF3592 domain-containing protein [Planctomycetota bacterium]MCH9790040.1 DUF3592 domain-containing protein [Planctomycetota bacterium]MDF1742113.1 DUF3592 domain-containing protein [Gimesia sp.]